MRNITDLKAIDREQDRWCGILNKILLTGSSGMIGTRVFEKLSSKYNVVGVDKEKNKWFAQLNEKTIIANLLRNEDLGKLPKDIDLIIHLAANARVYELVKNPEKALDNVTITFNILEFARRNDIDRIIFASSREVYGNLNEKGGIAEDRVRIENSESPYSASKIAAEALIHVYRKLYGIDFVILRFSNLYGMYDDSDRVIPLWIRQALRNEDLTVFGKDKILDFTYIDDAIEGVIKIIERFDEVKGETFNIAFGKGIKLNYVANKIKELLLSGSKIIIKQNRPGEVWKFQADVSKADKLLYYKPKIGIVEGLVKTVEWYKKLEERYED